MTREAIRPTEHPAGGGSVPNVRKLDKQVAARVVVELANRQADPRLPGCRAMGGQPNRWRVRVGGVGDYRIVYEIHDQQLLVLVVTVAHRREVYR